MNSLLVDIGNTRVKYTQYREKTTSHSPFAVQTVAHNELASLWRSLDGVPLERMVLTAGRGAAAQSAQAHILAEAKQRGMATTCVRVRPNYLPVNYTDIQQFGVDRFLHLLAGRQRYPRGFCVISAGTAITLDFFTDQHIGGMITLGLGSARDALREKTGLTALERPAGLLGDDTASSIGAGLYIGYQNLIERSIARVATQYHTPFQPLWTGGDAALLCRHGELVPELLFEGMSYYLETSRHDTD